MSLFGPSAAQPAPTGRLLTQPDATDRSLTRLVERTNSQAAFDDYVKIYLKELCVSGVDVNDVPKLPSDAAVLIRELARCSPEVAQLLVSMGVSMDDAEVDKLGGMFGVRGRSGRSKGDPLVYLVVVVTYALYALAKFLFSMAKHGVICLQDADQQTISECVSSYMDTIKPDDAATHGAVITAIAAALTSASVTYSLACQVHTMAVDGSIVLVDRTSNRVVSTIKDFNALQDAEKSAEEFHQCKDGCFMVEAIYKQDLVIAFKGHTMFTNVRPYTVLTGRRGSGGSISTYSTTELLTEDIAEARKRFVDQVAAQGAFPQEIRLTQCMNLNRPPQQHILNIHERAAANAPKYYPLPFSARGVAHALLKGVGPAAGEMDRAPPTQYGQLRVVEVSF